VNFELYKKLSFFRAISLVLFLLCAQFSLGSHSHIDDVHFEYCSTCLVAENAELDDIIPTAVASHNFDNISFSLNKTPVIFLVTKKRFQVFHLRGPPA